jgi:2,3-dihydroxybenzoate-AMP ligase
MLHGTAAAEHRRVRDLLLRAGAHRRDSGDGAELAPPSRAAPFPRRAGRDRVRIADRIGNFDYRDLAEELRAAALALRHVIVAGTPLPGQLALADLLRAGPFATPDISVDPAEVGTMLLSGGTTSVSRLIPRMHQDYVLNARLCGAAAGFGEGTAFMVVLPLGHDYNLASPGMRATLHDGGTVALAPSTDADAVFETVQRERVTVIAAAVPLIAGWLAGNFERLYALSSLKVVQNGGARLAPELRARLRERFGCIRSSCPSGWKSSPSCRSARSARS